MSLATQLLHDVDLDRGYGTYHEVPESPSEPRYQANFQKTISLHGDQNPPQFWYDCRGMERSLTYGAQTIRERYSHLYQKLEEAEAASAVARQQLEGLEESLEAAPTVEVRIERQAQLEAVQRKYDELEERVEKARKDLLGDGPKKGPIWRDLRKYLSDNLSARNKEDVIDEVTWRFSQNAIVACLGQVNKLTTEKFGGIFMAPHGDVAEIQKCTLDVQGGAAKITAHIKQRFPQFFHTTGQLDELEKPVTVDAVMTINVKPNAGLFSCCTGLPVKTTANVDIQIREEGVREEGL